MWLTSKEVYADRAMFFLNKSDLISFKNKQKSNNSIIQLAVVIVATASWKHPLLIQKKKNTAFNKTILM